MSLALTKDLFGRVLAGVAAGLDFKQPAREAFAREVLARIRAASVLETGHIEYLASLADRGDGEAGRMLTEVGASTGTQPVTPGARAMAIALVQIAADEADLLPVEDRRSWVACSLRRPLAPGCPVPIRFSYRAPYVALIRQGPGWARSVLGAFRAAGDPLAEIALELWAAPPDLASPDSRTAAAARLLLRHDGCSVDALRSGPEEPLEDTLAALLAWRNDPLATQAVSGRVLSLITPEEALRLVERRIPANRWPRQFEDLRQRALADFTAILPGNVEKGSGVGLLLSVCRYAELRAASESARRSRLAGPAVLDEIEIVAHDRARRARRPVTGEDLERARELLWAADDDATAAAIQAYNRRVGSLQGRIAQLEAGVKASFQEGLASELGPEWRESLRAMLGQLSPAQALVIEQKYFKGQTLRQIAEENGLALGTVKSHCHRALKKLESLARLRWKDFGWAPEA